MEPADTGKAWHNALPFEYVLQRVSPVQEWPLQCRGVVASDVNHSGLISWAGSGANRDKTMITLATPEIWLTTDAAAIIASIALLVTAFKS